MNLKLGDDADGNFPCSADGRERKGSGDGDLEEPDMWLTRDRLKRRQVPAKQAVLCKIRDDRAGAILYTSRSKLASCRAK